MTVHRPLVVINGGVLQLPAGDSVLVNGVPTYVQDAAPTPPGGAYIWWQTNYPSAGNMTMWLENGI